MNENDLKKLFIATNTDFSLQPYSNGWGGLLQYGMAVASAERKAHSSALEKLENLELQAVHGVATGWVCIPEVEWNSIIFNELPDAKDK